MISEGLPIGGTQLSFPTLYQLGMMTMRLIIRLFTCLFLHSSSAIGNRFEGDLATRRYLLAAVTTVTESLIVFKKSQLLNYISDQIYN